MVHRTVREVDAVVAASGVGWESTLPAVVDDGSGHRVVDESHAAEHSTGYHRLAEGKRPLPGCTQFPHTPGGTAAAAFAQHCTEDELPLPPGATNRRCWSAQPVATQAIPFSDGCCWDCTPVAAAVLAVAAVAPAVAAVAPAAEGVAGSWSSKMSIGCFVVRRFVFVVEVVVVVTLPSNLAFGSLPSLFSRRVCAVLCFAVACLAVPSLAWLHRAGPEDRGGTFCVACRAATNQPTNHDSQSDHGAWSILLATNGIPDSFQAMSDQ